MSDYIRYYGGKIPTKSNEIIAKSDIQVIQENWKFVRSEENEDQLSWEKRMTKKYYDKLFKEYCICDLSKYKEGKIAMRWRTEKEVLSGKGQFICANKTCSVEEGLRAWEAVFSYEEDGEKKSALIKVKLCEDCSGRINYKKQHKQIEKRDQEETKDVPKKADSNPSESYSNSKKNEKSIEEDLKEKSRGEEKEEKEQEKGKEREKEKKKRKDSSSSNQHEKKHKGETNDDDIDKFLKEMMQ